ncbi:MAG TPA: glycosyltransferase [Gemmatimonadales bacterium]|nr:glycosyltransferase [Gemmatimonadales bacterium]
MRRAGLEIALEGSGPARLAVAADSTVFRAAFAFAYQSGCPLAVYCWDLPPWEVGQGRPDHVAAFRGQVLKLPRLIGGYRGRPGFHSRNRLIAQRAAAVWTPSADARAAVETRYGVAGEQLPFCYDSDRFTPGLAPSGGRAVVLSVSRLVRYKNHAAVIRAAARLPVRPLVHLIGAGPEAGDLRKLALELAVELRLEEERLGDDAMVTAYRAASVVVCPSRFEGFGLTPMEGIAVGVPVVASDIPPHREFVAAQARLFPLDNDDALAAAIDAAINAGPRDSASTVLPLPDLTIEACAARFLPRLTALLAR